MYNNHSPTDKNSQYENPKLAHEEYIDTSGRLFNYNLIDNTSAEIEAELVKGVDGMRQQFRKTAKRLRHL
ncbi:hypothetical protein H7X69_00560 [Candidatus Saccharibacteria bacterium]|nr:hypothetical protein [Candidatus Saccharibacteria bacterium]